MIDLSKIKGVALDSRKVKADYIFIAIKGENHDGHDYIQQAIDNGASVIVSEKKLNVPGHVEFITSKNSAQVGAKIAAQYYGPFPDNIVAVTGTNGKSSVVHFVEQIWQVQGFKAASIGTLSGGLTSPDAVTLSQTLGQMRKDGITHVALEASSHGLQQYRLDGLTIKAAAFTNLSHDHLDYHANMEEYLKAKLRLFSDLLLAEGALIANADSPQTEAIKNTRHPHIQTYGRDAKDFKIISLTPTESGQKLILSIDGNEYEVIVPLVGEFQIYNVLCALGLSLMGDAPNEQAIAALSNLKPATGRLQNIPGHPEGAAIYVDYAHTPDALETVLKSLHPHVKNQLFCVFGCGGDRDQTKRAVMGRIAFDNADMIFITDDNPRNEKAVDIRKAILSGIPQITHNKKIFEIGDRAAAIAQSIKMLKKGDVLVIAGKGHESGQIIKDKTLPFNDIQEASRVIGELNTC